MTLPINLGASSGNPSGYPIQRSLRFRSSASANLTRTPSSTGNRKTWTWSAWLKRGSIAQTGTIWGSNFSSGGFGLAFGNYGGAGVNPEIMGVTLYAVGTVTTNAVFRDPSAWYHIVAKFDSTQATQANRFALYVNGVQQTLSGTLNVTLNADYNVNLSGALHVIGGESGYYNDCYLAEVNFIDGQALTPSSFGATDAVTGAWQPKKYTGTYGTNGFYLPFSDNTSATTLAYDKSGNGNNWTPNNISTTAGATYDSMTDVPTLTSATAANFCVLNPLAVKSYTTAGVCSAGNLQFDGGDDGTTASIAIPSSGKWYWEVTAGNIGFSQEIGIASASYPFAGSLTGSSWRAYRSYNGQKYNDAGGASYGATWIAGDVIGIAVDMDAGTITFYKNNSSQGTAFTDITSAGTQWFPCVSTTNASGTMYANFGQRPFSYTPPTGFKALNTFNLPDPTIKKPNQYMDATLYTGNGTATGNTQVITNTGSFQPDLVWIKSRSSATPFHVLNDSVRGTNKTIYTNSTGAEDSVSNVFSSFNANGFTVDYNSSYSQVVTNANGQSFVGWQWKKGATPGFDIVTYTGNGTAGTTIAHSLGVTPKMLIVKSRSIVSPNYGWQVQHTSLGATKSIVLNSTSAALTSTGFWNDTAPTSSVFTVGNDWDVNKSAATYVAYLFAEIPGFSKFGSYTGNGSADGPFVYCGFRPKYVMYKRTDSTGNWVLEDTSRSPYNVANAYLYANLSDSEGTGSYNCDIVSNGFKIRGGDFQFNQSGGTYVFAAFAENPMKYSLAR